MSNARLPQPLQPKLPSVADWQIGRRLNRPLTVDWDAPVVLPEMPGWKKAGVGAAAEEEGVYY